MGKWGNGDFENPIIPIDFPLVTLLWLELWLF